MRYLQRLSSDIRHCASICYLFDDEKGKRELIDNDCNLKKLQREYEYYFCGYHIIEAIIRDAIMILFKYNDEREVPTYTIESKERLLIKYAVKYSRWRFINKMTLEAYSVSVIIKCCMDYGKLKSAFLILYYYRRYRNIFTSNFAEGNVVMKASRSGRPKFLKLFYMYGYEMRISHILYAAEGHPKCLKLLHKWCNFFTSNGLVEHLKKETKPYPKCRRFIKKLIMKKK